MKLDQLSVCSTTDRDEPADVAPTPGAPDPAPPAPATAARPVAAKPKARPSAGQWRVIGAAAPVLAAEVGSRFLYVAEQGAVLQKDGSRLRITRKGQELLQVSTLKLQAVAVYGNVQITTQCMRALLDEGVAFALFSRSGTYRGRLQPPLDSGAAMRRRQWERASDPAFCLGFAKAIVRGKILGASQVAQAYSKNYVAETLGTAHTTIRDTLAGLDAVPDLDALRGAEGAAARAWFELFGRCNRSDLPFDGRNRRPTEDPLNALLSFGYMLLLRELEGLLQGAGLDPAVGFYHAPHGTRPALACDWLEEFRHAVVDRLVLKLANLGTIRAEYFEDHGERGIRLTTDGLRVFLRAYEQLLLGGGEDGRPGGFRAVFLQQLGRLLDALSGRGDYRSFLDDDAQPQSGGGAGGPDEEALPVS